ncbi:RNA polymerase sigma factor [Streptomyces filamentosus]|uniref:RNA polymerase sigma factor n=1 Tax=Streptomyces filamentosus TaxID=67294 RepID=UPI0033D3C99B
MSVTEVPAPPALSFVSPALLPPEQPQLQDEDGFDAFYKSEMRRVSLFLMHTGASVYEAADAAHEAFLTLLPDKWRSLEHPGAWLRTVAYRNYLRQATVRTQPTDPVPDRAGGTCPVDLVLLTEEQTRVLKALAQLSPAEREAMAWNLDGFSHEETARALGKKPDAVRQAYVRARKRLISFLGLKKEAESGE